jgi:hypothetical protein
MPAYHRTYAVPVNRPARVNLMEQGLLDEMVMEPSYVERQFDIDCHVSGRGVRIRDCDNPSNPPLFFENIDGNDVAAIDQEIQNYLEHESIPHCDAARWLTAGVDVGREDVQCFRSEYQSFPPFVREIPGPRPTQEDCAYRIEDRYSAAAEEIREIPSNRVFDDALIARAQQSASEHIDAAILDESCPAGFWQGITRGPSPLRDWASRGGAASTEQFNQLVGRLSRPTSERDRPRTRRHRHYLTWMPYSSYRKCATCFMDDDLKVMRGIVLRVLKYLDRGPTRHTNRAAELWRGHTQSLIRYGIAIALECRQRGFRDTSLAILRAKYQHGHSEKPQWVYWPALHESHQAYLLLRDERRFAVSILNEGRRRHGQLHSCPSLIVFCQNMGFSQKRDWNMDTINNIRHIIGELGTTINLVHNNFYRQQGWVQSPAESFRYPEDNVCSV